MYNGKKPLPNEIQINLPLRLLEEASKEYDVNLSKKQLKELESEVQMRFKNYCDKCRKQGNIDETTGYPKNEAD
jgi:hypothetical protein